MFETTTQLVISSKSLIASIFSMPEGVLEKVTGVGGADDCRGTGEHGGKYQV